MDTTTTEDATASETKGKKHARALEQVPEGEPPNKRNKSERPKTKLKLPRPPQVNAALKAALKAKAKQALLTHPKWKVLTPVPASGTPEVKPLTSLRPRIWTGNREELLAILPELAGPKCANGISWHFYENPMLTLDDTTTSFFEVKLIDDLTFDLTTTRLFTCPKKRSPRTQLDESDLIVMKDHLTEDFKPICGTPPNVHYKEPVPGNHVPHLSTTSHSTPISQIPPSFGIPQEVDFKPMRPHFTPRINYQTISPDTFYDYRSLNMLIGTLAEDLRTGTVGEARGFIGTLDRPLAKDLVGRLAAKLKVDLIPDGLPPGRHPEFEFLVKKMQVRNAKGKEKEILDNNRVRVPQLVNPYAPHDPNIPPPPSALNDLPLLPYQTPIQDGQARIIAGMDGIVLSPPPNSADESQPHPLQRGLAKDTTTTTTAIPLVPKPIPEELQEVIDAYVFGRPLTIILSHQHLRDHWSLRLPSEYGYVVMGFFRIIGVEERPLGQKKPMPATKTSTSKDFISGQVRWRFRLRWAAGGEDAVWPDQTEGLTFPWWSPSIAKKEDEDEDMILSDCDDKEPTPDPEDAFPTSEQYRELRRRNPEFQWRFQPLNDLYCFFFPAHLLMPFTAKLSDVNFPWGWICQACGRLNFQNAMRHRKCRGSQCKDEKSVSYFLDLFLLRDPQHRLTLPLPCNVYPASATVKCITWEDGTRTLSCCIPNAEKKATWYMKHIFTGNLPHLQVKADKWLQEIQTELEIVRKPGDNGPYFKYSASCWKKAGAARWPDVPDCVNEIKDGLVHRTKHFGEVPTEKIRIQRLDISAWMTSGFKKVKEPFHAKTSPVVLLCLGCNVALNVVPRSKKTVHHHHSAAAAAQAEEKEDTQGRSGWIAQEPKEEEEQQEDGTTTTAEGSKSSKQVVSFKDEPHSFTFSLVHGDVLVLFGDDFEYAIKRDGTSFLVSGSALGGQ